MYHVINIVMLILHIHMVSGTGIAGVCIIKDKGKELSFISFIPFQEDYLVCYHVWNIS